MKNIVIPSLGSLPTFTRTEATSDVFWTERANYDVGSLFYALNSQGMTISQPETTDIDTLTAWLASVHTALNTFIEDFLTWLNEGGDYPTEPSIPSLPGNYDFFYKDVLLSVSGWYEVLRKCRMKQIEKLFVDTLRDGQGEIADAEKVVNIGDHKMWSKSLSIDEF